MYRDRWGCNCRGLSRLNNVRASLRPFLKVHGTNFAAVLFYSIFAMAPIPMLQCTRLGETGESDGSAALSLTKHQLITSEQSTNQFLHNLHKSLCPLIELILRNVKSFEKKKYIYFFVT